MAKRGPQDGPVNGLVNQRAAYDGFSSWSTRVLALIRHVSGLSCGVSG